jgi:hypothetical protein
LYLRSHPIYKIIVPLFAATLFSSSASCQTDSFEALPPLPSPVEHTLRIPAAGNFDITTLRLRTFAPDSTRERWAEGNPPPERWRYEFPAGTSQQSQTQKQEIDQHGLVMRAVKRTWQDQKELYLTPFKPSNFKWDALVLGGDGGAFGVRPAH